MRFAKAVLISLLSTLFLGAIARADKNPPPAGYLGHGHQRLSMPGAVKDPKAVGHHKNILHVHRPHLHFPHL